MKASASLPATQAPVPAARAQAQADQRPATGAQRQALAALDASPRQVAQRQALAAPNRTGLPDNLKAGVESLSGHSLDDVKVHYNSSKPMQLQALAYAQGANIHVGPGQEKHLPHETWHVVQQKQGRVKPTRQFRAVGINDNQGLEQEADTMGQQAETFTALTDKHVAASKTRLQVVPVVQRMLGGSEVEEESEDEVEENEEDRHPDDRTARAIDDLTEITDVTTDEFLGRHICQTNIHDAEQQARNRLNEQHFAPISTVVVMGADDQKALASEVRHRNHVEFYGTAANYRSLYPVKFVTVYRDGTPTVRGVGHILYNVVRNGRTFVVGHLAGVV